MKIVVTMTRSSEFPTITCKTEMILEHTGNWMFFCVGNRNWWNEPTARNFFRSRPSAISLTREKALLISHLTSSAISQLDSQGCSPLEHEVEIWDAKLQTFSGELKTKINIESSKKVYLLMTVVAFDHKKSMTKEIKRPLQTKVSRW